MLYVHVIIIHHVSFSIRLSYRFLLDNETACMFMLSFVCYFCRRIFYYNNFPDLLDYTDLLNLKTVHVTWAYSTCIYLALS